ncbi:MAG: diguanylate cyclase [Rhodocyclaceae bacterium]
MKEEKQPTPCAHVSPALAAKETLGRMAKTKQTLLPQNYCRVYREVTGEAQPWTSFCAQSELLADLMCRLLTPWTSNGGEKVAPIADHARDLTRLLRDISREADVVRARTTAESLGSRIHDRVATDDHVQAALAKLIRLVAASLADLAGDDKSVRGQISILEKLLCSDLTPASVQLATSHLQRLIDQQRETRRSLDEAQQTLRIALAKLVEQAGEMAQDTSEYEAKVVVLARDVENANDVSGIKTVVAELGGLLKEVGDSIRQSRDIMTKTHVQLTDAERQIAELRQRLADTSERARRDALTGAMNRAGLEQIWQREAEQSIKNRSTLSLGILDIDNFKKLNDTYGHKTGDDALMHLVGVVKEALRGLDTVARLGGEEFVILLPETGAEGAEAVLQRLQRELTKHFFLANNERVLITFSGGVTQVRLGEDSLQSAVARADGALYEAKRTGKNRVCVA